ncbi:Rhs family protein [Lysobacter enzymogenes]|uniref:Rhs family protein n=1 Tax=Lysobacter enzymogenes TaxID=69 RepID=A0A0S2DQJ6_LYSEN|nr:RHS repeat-associated core domain-containing protein [Lysobacter enzymogenes]ALN60868.1 Rhs family protein [Lysobacter enzymogenes]QCW24430.1 RHS repeat protein [Lysobacter enzymogenes]
MAVALAVAIQSLPLSAIADETNRVWTTDDAVGSPFQSEYAVQEAIKKVADHVPDGEMLKFESGPSLILRNKVISSMSVMPLPPKTGPWTWMFYPRVLNAVSYDDALVKTKAFYDNESRVTGCAPNTVLTVDPNSRKTYWDDGVTLKQENYTFSVTYQSGVSGTCTPSTYSNLNIGGIRTVSCPSLMSWDADKQACAGGRYFSNGDTAYYSAPVLPPGQCPIGNPCDPTTGDKMQPEEDFDLGWVSFTRYFHSMTSTPMGGLGDNWTHSHNLRLTSGTNPTSSSDTVYVGFIEADGAQISFTQVGDVYESDDGKGDRAVKDGDQWKLYRSDRILRFGADGRLLEQQLDDGTSLTYGYDAKQRLATITHSTGRSLVFAYTGDGARDPIASISSAGEAIVTYGYTAGGQVETATYANSLGRRYHYEDARFPRYLTGVTTELGQRFSTFAYDDKGRVISSQHAGGADGVTLSYPAEGGTKFTNPLGQVTELQLADAPWSGAPQKIGGIKDTRGTVATTYNDEGSDFRRRVVSTTDRNGIETRHTYAEATDPVTGALARTETITEAFGKPEQRVQTVTTDVTTGRLIRSTVGNQETRIARNARLQPVSVTVRDTTTNETRTTSYAYCEAADVAAANSPCPTLGLLKSIDGPRTDVNDIVRFEYYGSDDSTCATTPALCTYRKGDVRRTINALGQATEVLGYDSQGRLLSIVDVNGVATDYEYLPRGWLSAVKQRGADDGSEQDDRITKLSYYLTGPLETVRRPDGTSTDFNYDGAHRLVSFSDSAGFVRYTLDNAGNRKTEEIRSAPTQPVKKTMSRVYNTFGQLTAHKDSAQNATLYDYDPNGNLKLTTDPLGRKTQYSYDPLGRISETLADSLGLKASTKVKYNALDQVSQVTDPNNQITTYAYNGFGDQTKLTSPDTGVTDFTYNAAGHPATRKDANDTVAHRYAYDALNRITAEFYTASGPADVEYTYDAVNPACTTGENFAVGRLSTIRKNGTELKYCYDRFGRVTRKDQTVGALTLSLRYTYTKTNQISSITYPDGGVVDYVRGPDGNVLEIGVTPANGLRAPLVKGALYNPLGPVASWTYGADTSRILRRTYDLDYRPQTILDSTGGGLSLGYGYNVAGELIELKDGLQSVGLASYEYDTLGRLTKALEGGNAIETYSYDKTGNRKSLLHGGITDTYVYPTTNHRLSSVAGVARGYDAVGNTTNIGGAAREFVYDSSDRLSQVKQNGVAAARYRYNALGERVGIENGAGSPLSYTIYDESGNWIGDYDANGAAQQQAIWIGDAPAGLLVGHGSAQKVMYVESDHLGTPRSIIDPSRNTAIWTWDAKGEVFGNDPPNQDPDLDGTTFVFNMRFPGQRYDAASGLVYNYLRDGYDPRTGRYSQPDPIGLSGGISLYAYAGSNPTSFSDPTGLKVNVVESDPRMARALMRAYGELNYRSQTARFYNGALEARSTVYKIKYKKGKAMYCPPNGSGECEGHAFTIFIDPCHAPELPTTAGDQPVPFLVMLMHELGHAFGYNDNAAGTNMLGDNVEFVENPTRKDLGYPMRNSYKPTTKLAPVVATPPKK